MYRILTGALTAALLTTGAAHATTVPFWLYDANDNSLITSDGVLSYDDSLLGPVFTALEDFSLSFTADGVSYSEANAAGDPTLYFFGSTLVSFGFTLVDGNNGVDFSGLGISEAWFGDFSYVTAPDPHYAIMVETTPLPAVPLPAGAPLAASALGALGLLRRKKKKQAA